ncbi:hypothetical protein VTO42DRAFT_4699 [Malbranchea cinnamomea]
MSTAVVPATAAPLPAPVDRVSSPKSYPPLAPLSTAAPSSSPSATPSHSAMESSNESPDKATPTDEKRSPNTSRSSGGTTPKIAVKKEPPASPSLRPGTRHRPRKLDLSTTTTTTTTARGPVTAREGGLGIQDVGLACLSPGFQTQDPAMREQLQRSAQVREQQRSIIEARLQKSAKGDGPDGTKPSESSNLLGASQSKPSTKKRPPPGLSIVPPSASQFANERVIQSAPLNQTFTGRHQTTRPATRHFVSHTTELSSASPHIHHTPANQTNNRLPPISDVFGADALAPRDRDRNALRQPPSSTSQTHNLGPLPSPGLPVNGSNGVSLKRPREYRSAEEAVHEMTGGREDLLPRIVHYSGSHNQAASPPSSAGNAHAGAVNGGPPPLSGHLPQQQQPLTSHLPGSTSRRRTRSEYEQDNGSPPLGTGPDPYRRVPSSGSYGPFGAGRDSPDTQRRKKEEFLSLCARAWDLFHS